MILYYVCVSDARSTHMEKTMQVSRTHSERLVVQVPPDTKRRVVVAAKVRDGGNLSHFVRRAVDELIERENLIPETTEPQELAS